MLRFVLFLFCGGLLAPFASALTHPVIVATAAEPGSFALVAAGHAAPLVVDGADFKGVQRAVGDLRDDIRRVTSLWPELAGLSGATNEGRVVIGTLGHSALIDGLVAAQKLDVAAIQGRWEAFLIQQVGADLIVVGSDKRGTIYGVYELSEQIGVSPWYWWADVPVKTAAELYVSATGAGLVDEGPTVRYRGIFLNDEAPALTGWVGEKFGAFDHTFYTKVFELLLRLRANYIWPAMWQPRAFSADDPLNPELADEYGIVIGTSHHEPLMRAHDEWTRGEDRGPWDYAKNDARLREFWRGGVERAKPYESLYTIGMRGDGDSAMSADTNTALLERIVADQRQILTEVLGQPAETVPQLWALYKEVQDYYEAGMRVPDDVILLWCDDNWGNIRRLPTPAEMQRLGGAGVYYHFDYVGGPRNYKWLNVRPISKVWEQMHLAWQHEANRIWIVNVGDLKPMEFPIEFFLTMARDPAAMTYGAMRAYTAKWAAREFGAEHATEIAALIDGYTRLNSQRTPEMTAPDTYSLTAYDEAERVIAEWQDLSARAEAVNEMLPEEARSAFAQLVLYPVLASANVRQMYVAAARSALWAEQGRVAANEAAEEAMARFERNVTLADWYHQLSDGKWNHLMADKKTGYTYWNSPPVEVAPAVTRVRPNAGAEAGLAVAGNPLGYPRWGVPPPTTPALSIYDQATSWVELFNRGSERFTYAVEVDDPWLRVRPLKGAVKDQTRLHIEPKWDDVPVGVTSTGFSVRTSAGERFRITVPIVNPVDLRPGEFAGHVEVNGHVAIEAPHFTRAVANGAVQWLTMDGFGRTMGAVTTMPVRAADETLGPDATRLEYDIFTRTTGEVQLELQLAPSLNYQSGEGLRLAVSIDEEEPQVLKLDTWKTLQTWEKAVGDGVTRVTTTVTLATPGKHTLKFWRVSPGVVLERLVLGNPTTWRTNGQGVLPSYLGPPESPRG